MQRFIKKRVAVLFFIMVFSIGCLAACGEKESSENMIQEKKVVKDTTTEMTTEKITKKVMEETATDAVTTVEEVSIEKIEESTTVERMTGIPTKEIVEDTSIERITGRSTGETEEDTTTDMSEKATEEITTEKENDVDPTKYEYNGTMLIISSKDEYDFFKGLKIKPKAKIFVNGIYGDSSDEQERADFVIFLYNILGDNGKKTLEEDGYQKINGMFSIPYEDNYFVEYKGEDIYVFEYIGISQGKYFFDVYRIK